jgi:hypothetical protein
MEEVQNCVMKLVSALQNFIILMWIMACSLYSLQCDCYYFFWTAEQFKAAQG